jgi:hypothetical protein
MSNYYSKLHTNMRQYKKIADICAQFSVRHILSDTIYFCISLYLRTTALGFLMPKLRMMMLPFHVHPRHPLLWGAHVYHLTTIASVS